MDMDTIEKGFLWVLFVIGLAFFGTAFFMKSRLDIVMRIVFGGVIAILALSEIYPGLVKNILRKLASMIITTGARLTRKTKKLRRREAINETDIVETKRL